MPEGRCMMRRPSAFSSSVQLVLHRQVYYTIWTAATEPATWPSWSSIYPKGATT
jgi:hypothetical protein